MGTASQNGTYFQSCAKGLIYHKPLSFPPGLRRLPIKSLRTQEILTPPASSNSVGLLLLHQHKGAL